MSMKKVAATVILAANIGVMYACCILGSMGVTPPLPTMIIFMVAAFFMPASVGNFNDKMYKEDNNKD